MLEMIDDTEDNEKVSITDTEITFILPTNFKQVNNIITVNKDDAFTIALNILLQVKLSGQD